PRLLLSPAPTRTEPRASKELLQQTTRVRAAVLGVAGGVAIGAVSFGFSVLLLKSYNASVFLGTPFTMGAVAGYFYNRAGPQPRTVGLGAMTVVIGSLATLLFALAGAFCIAITLPPARPSGPPSGGGSDGCGRRGGRGSPRGGGSRGRPARCCSPPRRSPPSPCGPRRCAKCSPRSRSTHRLPRSGPTCSDSPTSRSR